VESTYYPDWGIPNDLKAMNNCKKYQKRKIWRCKMLKVTETAKEKLKETLQEHSEDPEVIVRVIINTTVPSKFLLVWDKEKEGDQVVKSKEGENLLAIEHDLSPSLDGMVLDYQNKGFTLSPFPPGG